MNILIVYCHPLPESFTGAVLQAALRGFAAGDHQVKVIDLYGMGFDPVLGAEEKARYLSDPQANIDQVREHVDALLACEALVVIYPTWFYGPPAMLKGWLERVWLPEAVFTVAQFKGDIARGKLRNIRHFVGLTSSGSPWWWLRLIRDPGRSLFTRGLRANFAMRCKTTWLQLHNMNNVTTSDCQRHLARVERACARLS